MDFLGLFNPKDTAESIPKAKAYQLKWWVQGNGYMQRDRRDKVFSTKEDALKYEHLLKECADVLDTFLETKIEKI